MSGAARGVPVTVEGVRKGFEDGRIRALDRELGPFAAFEQRVAHRHLGDEHHRLVVLPGHGPALECRGDAVVAVRVDRVDVVGGEAAHDEALRADEDRGLVGHGGIRRPGAGGRRTR